MMDSETLRQEFVSLVFKGPLTDIIHGEEAWAIADTIGRHAAEINDAGFGSLGASLQVHMADLLVLAVGRVFERPRGYPTRGIPAALDFLDQHAAQLPIQQPQFFADLRPLGIRVDPWSGIDAARARGLLDQMRTLVPDAADVAQSDHAAALSRVKIRRDKRIAHNEAYEISEKDKASWRELVHLLELGRQILSPIAWGFGSAVVDPPGQGDITSGSARGLASSLEALLTRAGVVQAT